MNEGIGTLNAEDQRNGSAGWSSEWIFGFLALALFGFGNFDNQRINELEKKVARLEGQMSIIGGKFHE